MNAIMVSGVHDEARRLRIAAAFLATADRSAAGDLTDTSPMSSKMRGRLESWKAFRGFLHHIPPSNREAKPKFHARGTIWRMNAIIMSGVHYEARRLRAADLLATADCSAAGRRADAWPPSRPPFCDDVWDSGWPRLKPLFFPPPLSSFTVAQALAQALRSAAFSGTARDS
jgi:hypothetical protein